MTVNIKDLPSQNRMRLSVSEDAIRLTFDWLAKFKETGETCYLHQAMNDLRVAEASMLSLYQSLIGVPEPKRG